MILRSVFSGHTTWQWFQGYNIGIRQVYTWSMLITRVAATCHPTTPLTVYTLCTFYSHDLFHNWNPVPPTRLHPLSPFSTPSPTATISMFSVFIGLILHFVAHLFFILFFRSFYLVYHTFRVLDMIGFLLSLNQKNFHHIL